MRSMDPFDTKKFKGLHKAWMRKLKDSGFKDIEDLRSNEERLKTWDSYYFPLRANEIETSREYYETAEHLLVTHEFDSEIERMVWALHCEGKSVREIEDEITASKAYAWFLLAEEKTLREKLNKDRINSIIQRMQKFIGRR